MGWIVIVFVACVACLGAALPTGNTDLVREKRTPVAVAARTMTMDEYMRAQQSQGYNYERPAKRFDPYARTGSGSTSTGSAYGAPGCGSCHQEDKEPSPAAPPTVQEEPEQEVIPERKPKSMAPRVPKRRPVKEEEDEEEEAPVSNTRRKTKTNRGPSYSNFFPMMFTGSSGSARNADGDEGQNPGGLIAIANSFSTGEGAVASSRAVALGSRETSQNRKSSPSRYRS